MSDDQQPPRLTKGDAAPGDPDAAPDPAASSPAASSPAASDAAVRGIARSRRHKAVGGVCGGLGRYFDLDPVVFRVPLAVLALFGGLGLVFYGLAWLMIPAEGEEENELRRLLSGRVEGASLSAILVALVGCGLFLASLRAGYTSFSLLVAGAVGGAAYWSQRRRRAETAGVEGAPADDATAHAVAEAPPETQAPPVPSTPSWWRDPLTKDGADLRNTGYLWGPDEDAPYTDADRRAFRCRRRRERRSYGGAVFVLAQIAALVAGGVALGTSRSLADSLVVALAAALLVYGAALVVTAFAGRVGGGTVFLVVLTAMGLAAASVVPQNVAADWERRRWTPPTAAAVRPYYEHGTGRGTLDLTRVSPGEGERVRTRVRLGVGELRVWVPEDVAVRMDIEVGVGGYRLPVAVRGGPDERRGGGGLGVTGSRTLPPAAGEEAHGTLVLDLDVGVGEIVVARKEASAR